MLYAYLPDWGQAQESLDQTQTTRKFATRKRSGLGDDAFEGNDGKRYHVGFRKGDAMVVLAGADKTVVNQAASAIEKRVVLAGLGGDIR